LITEAASVAPAVVSWFERGEAFIVHDPESAKLGELLQKHFNRKFRLWNVLQFVLLSNILTHVYATLWFSLTDSKFGSLQRQLNMHGFSKSRKAGK
jgi:hypothetical protein